MIEMMVVVAVIVIVLASLIPVVGTLMNNNGVAGASNQVAAFIGNARSDALYDKIPTGVVVYIDPISQQTTLAEVQADQQAVPATGGGIYSFLANGNSNYPPVTAIELINHYDATLNQFVYDRDVLPLPRGVGIALYNNQAVPASKGTPSLDDRYFRMGLIMFNPDGTLANTTFGIQKVRQKLINNAVVTPNNQLWHKLGPTSASTLDVASIVSTTPVSILTSSPGFVFYDTEKFLSQRTVGNGNPFNNVDLEYILPAPPPGSLGGYDKSEEEYWLDQNGVAVLVSQFNGALIKAK